MSDMNITQMDGVRTPGGVTSSTANPPGFDLLGEVGRGGMGVVYRARDLSLNREVAVKILQEQYAQNASTARRFVDEAHITGQLQHPGIPAIYQVGSLSDGRPFLAMKLIKGQTLAELLQAGTPIDPLAVFEAISHAVGYAHAHGVIHRDLKPANVMIGAFGEVQVMDWGLAKVLASGGRQPPVEAADPEATTAPTEIKSLRDRETPFTQDGSALGTPAFMPPEQAAGELDKIGTRSDVFGLGAILCVLLTGRPPFDGADAEAVRRNAIRGQTGAALARLDGCGADPDVTALCKQCLAFEPADRPATAGKVAAAVAALRRAADDRARQAERDRLAAEVRAAEQAKRRRAVLRATGAVAAVLLLGVAGTTAGLIWANAARQAEADQRHKADAATKEAEAKEAEAKAVLQFFEDKVFAAARPKGQAGGLGSDVTLRDAIAACLPDLAAAFADQPLVEARLRMALGITYWHLGDAKASGEQYERARALRTEQLGPDHPDTLRSMHGVARSYLHLGRYADALKLQEETVAAQKRVLGPDHPDTLRSNNNLALGYLNLGRHADALKLHEETLAAQKRVLPPDHPDTLLSMQNLANSYFRLGRHADALKLREETLASRKRVLGPDHPDTLQSMLAVANWYGRGDRGDDALKVKEEVLAAQKRVLPPDHPDTLANMLDLVLTYRTRGNAEVVTLGEEALAACRRAFPPDHPYTLASMSSLALDYRERGRHADAFRLAKEVLAACRRAFPPDHLNTLESLRNLAKSYAGLGRHADAVKLYEETLAACQRAFPPDHPNTLESLRNLAKSYAGLGRHAEAVKLHDEALAAYRRVLGSGHFSMQVSMQRLTKSYAALGRLDDVLKLWEETLADYRRVRGPDHSDTRGCMRNLAAFYASLDRHAEALRLRQEMLAHYMRKQGPDGPGTLNSLWEVADSLTKLNRGAEAIPLIDQCVRSADKDVYGRMIPAVMGLRVRHFQQAADPANCRATAAMWEELNRPDADSLYHAACYRAVAASVFTQANQPAEAAADADRAMAWLTQAVAAGYRNRAHMEKDNDLDVLRSRPDFQNLLATLPKPPEAAPPPGPMR